MSRYDGLIIPRSYSEYINKTDAATLSQALQLPGVMDAAPTTGSIKPVQSGGVDNALKILTSLPTDAVLHYSFDEVPDYPDGTADLRKEYGETKDNTNGYLHLNGTQTVTNVNGNFHCTSTSANGGVYIDQTMTLNKICIAKVRVIKGNVRIGLYGNEKGIGSWVVTLYSPKPYYIISASAEETEWELEYVYIGDGSYSTPIIDNANGQNNATNNGGIAVKGVSGKGIKFFSNNQVSCSNFNIKENFAISFWANPDNDDINTIGYLIYKNGVFYIQNGYSNNKFFYITLTNPASGNNQFITTNTLLQKNVFSHIVCVKNGTNFILYINGVKIKTQTVGADVAINNNDLIIGNTNRPQSIDDLLIFDRALSDTEVMALYLNKANTPKYYSWADWKLAQTETATRNAPETKSATIETPSEETQEEK